MGSDDHSCRSDSAWRRPPGWLPLGVACLVWLSLCLPWLAPHLLTEASAWRRYFRKTGDVLGPRFGPYEAFLHDVHRSTRPDATVAIVGEKTTPSWRMAGETLFLYPRKLSWLTFDDGFEKAATKATHLGVAHSLPPKIFPGDTTVLWVRRYAGLDEESTIYGCLLRGDLPIPDTPCLTRGADKFSAYREPGRALLGLVAFMVAMAVAGLGWALLLLPRARAPGLMGVGSALALGFIGNSAVISFLMVIGLGLRTGTGLALAMGWLWLWHDRERARDWGRALRQDPLPWWLWTVFAAGALRCLLCGLVPAYGWDTWMIWFLKARVLWIDDGLQGEFWRQAHLWSSHPIYPVTWPVAGAVAGVFCGGPDAYVFNWAYQAVAFSGFVLVGGLAWRLGGARLAAAAMVAFLLLPSLWNIKDFGYADMAMLVVAFAAAAWLAVACRERDAAGLVPAVAFAWLAPAVKIEGGLFFAVFAIIAFAAWRALRRTATDPGPDWNNRIALRLLLPGLVLAWYLLPLVHGFPEERLKESNVAAWSTNLAQAPTFAAAFLRQFFSVQLPVQYGVAPLPPGTYWALDESLFGSCSYRFLHLPLLAILLWLGLLYRRVPLGYWLPVYALALLTALLYPLLYVPNPADLPASIQRLSLQLVCLQGVAILLACGLLGDAPAPAPPVGP